jgi:hypothetical protein
VVHFVHLANLVMRWLLQIQMHDRHTNTSPVACSGLSSASLSGLQPRSRLLPSATLPRPQPLIRASVHLRIATRPMSRVQVMIAAIGCACVCVSARVTCHEVMRRARKRELHSTHARHTDSLRPSIRISVRIAFLPTTCPVVEVHGRSLCHYLTPLATTHRTC